MRLLQCSDTGDFSLTQVDDEALPRYAILSHTWGIDAEEVTFEDLTNSTGKDKPGYEKIRFCGEQAAQDGLEYFWVDTCCIDKRNRAELARAINSMFRWYRNSTRCYVYLSDVSSPLLCTNNGLDPQSELDFRKSKWFTRGWTLQELLAPSSVEFFSWECKRLGDKGSLARQIHEITNIPMLALQRVPLSQFSVDERLSWIEHRQTKLEEDRAYSMLGIFDVYLLPIYSEGAASAFKRLIDKINKRKKCVQDLRVTDPRDDKKRIEDTKGGLLEDSYRWILENFEFQQWRNNQQSQLLWIKGDPGKGKTMLLCGIINELNKSIVKTALLSYFFCQATDSRINTATAVLRGLLYLLVDQQPSLVSHMRKRHDHAGKSLFEDANAWVAICEIFIDILQDSNLSSIYLVIDALDECLTDLPKLQDFIEKSLVNPRVKWIISSRNNSSIEQRLRLNEPGMRLSLELKENAKQISRSVNMYIKHRISSLVEIQHDKRLQDAIQKIMQQKANSTFLWVSLVFEELRNVMAWEVLEVLNEIPTSLKDIYHRMIKHIKCLQRQYPKLCQQILATVIATYRPLHLRELHALSGLPTTVQNVNKATAAIVRMCGSFLTIQDDNVYIIHQSARDFLSNDVFHDIFPHGTGDVHHSIYSKSLEILSRTLCRDMHSIRALGHPLKQVQPQDPDPEPDPLAVSGYPCIFWIDHLCNWSHSFSTHSLADLQDGGTVDEFMRSKYLYWLEALSLYKSMSKGVIAIAKLETLVNERADSVGLIGIVRDAHRFILAHKLAIETSPLQTYISALVFSPAHSLIRGLFQQEEPKWITIAPAIADKWSACLQTLEGHGDQVTSVAFSHDSTKLVSASYDKTVNIWDVNTGECIQTLKGHTGGVTSVVFSHDSTRLASASIDGTVKIWCAGSGECLLTLEEHSDLVRSVAFSHNSTRVALASVDETVKIWDANSGKCLQTLMGHSGVITSVTFSYNSAWLASASNNRIIKIWNANNGECLRTLVGHSNIVTSVAFSHDMTRLASASFDKTVKIWDASSGECLRTLGGHSDMVTSVTFSHDSTQLASASADRIIKIWDAHSGECLKMLRGHSYGITSITFSHNSTRIASTSHDKTVKIWDAGSGESTQTLQGHRDWIVSMAFSHDSTRLASASHDKTVKIWDAGSGKCLQTLRGHSDMVTSLAFSYDSVWVASVSVDGVIKIWDANSGRCLRTLQKLEEHSDSVRSIAFSHDSTHLASASFDRTVKIWDIRTSKCIKTLKGHSKSVWSVAFSHDTTRLASASYDKTVKIWDTTSSECLQTLEGHRKSVWSVAFSHDSTRLASASSDETVKIWDAGSGECLKTLKVGRGLFNISFDTTDSYLHTELGNIDIRTLTDSVTCSTISEFCDPHYQGLGISLDNVWITYNAENLVWLPSEYRPVRLAVAGQMIGIGAGAGKVWICKIKRPASKGVRASVPRYFTAKL